MNNILIKTHIGLQHPSSRKWDTSIAFSAYKGKYICLHMFWYSVDSADIYVMNHLFN